MHSRDRAGRKAEARRKRIVRLHKGSALIITLLMSAIIFILAVCFSTMVTVESKTVQYNNFTNIALYVADAGLQRAFTDLVNLGETPFNSLTVGGASHLYCCDVAYMSEGDIGVYTATICGKGYPESAYAPVYDDPVDENDEAFGWVPIIPSEPAPQPSPNSRGRFRWEFTILSLGVLKRDDTTAARRSLLAKVLVSRAEDTDDYQGYGKIEYWSEQNR